MHIFQLHPFSSFSILTTATTLDAWSLSLPDGWYTTFRTFNGGQRALGLHRHLQRVLLPAQHHHLPLSLDAKTLRQRIADCLSGLRGDWRIRLTLTPQPQLWMAVEPLQLPTPEIYQNGVRVNLTQLHRHNPTEKSTAFIHASTAERQNLAAQGIYEGLLTHNDRILEGLTSNFYSIQNDTLFTAKYGVLPGVTRSIILTLAHQIGLTIRYRAPRRTQIANFTEAFLSSSSRGIVPITQIDETTIANGSPGKWTQHLIHAYTTYLETHTQPIAPRNP
ncbi:MAG: hypothetical protein OHK0052_24180 [Anaerolineales bacterium]